MKVRVAIVALALLAGCGPKDRRRAFTAPVTGATPEASPRDESPRPAPAPATGGVPASSGTAAVDSGLAPLAGGEVLTLAEILESPVVFEDLTPDVKLDDAGAGKPSATAVLFDVTPGPRLAYALALETAAPFTQELVTEARDARWRIEDSRTGLVLAEGPVVLPDLCDCGAADDHLIGDVRVPHAATMRLDVPRVSTHERLRIIDGAGAVLATVSLDKR